jgi:hypothetical protein
MRSLDKCGVRGRIENKVLYSNNETNAKVWRGLKEQCLICRVWVTCSTSKMN